MSIPRKFRRWHLLSSKPGPKPKLISPSLAMASDSFISIEKIVVPRCPRPTIWSYLVGEAMAIPGFRSAALSLSYALGNKIVNEIVGLPQRLS
jgi:hypothetical protein